MKAVLPDEQNFKVSMGMLIAQALKKATAGAKAMVGAKLPSGALRRLTDATDSEIVSKHGRRLSRRRLAAELVSADGSFNLGGIPKSSKPDLQTKAILAQKLQQKRLLVLLVPLQVVVRKQVEQQLLVKQTTQHQHQQVKVLLLLLLEEVLSS